MNSNLARRGFLRNAALGSLAVGLSSSPFAQTALSTRLEWSVFKRSRDYASFMDAIKKMRANTNPADKRSWQYWTNAHLNYCPHSVSYFISWHRGYLRLFENQLREISGNPRLTLPYWDYYRDPTIPREFTDPSPANPLYVNRINTRVRQALTLAPFSSTLTHFQRETNDSFVNAVAFEPSLENQPHNPIHDLIGGIMSTMQSPLDPIFWLHHANIDRLANAWAAAGGGRTLPPAGDPYWSGSFLYATKLTMLRAQTMNSRVNLGYFYDNEKMPTTLPAAVLAPSGEALVTADGASLLAAPGQQADAVLLPSLPPPGGFAASQMRVTGTNRLALGGALGISLNNSSVSARVGLDRSGHQMLQSVLDSFQLPPSAAATGASKYKSVKAVLTNVKTSKKGEDGGYFYNLYLNLPDEVRAVGAVENYLCGNVGPFRLMSSQRGQSATAPRIEFDVTGLLLANRNRDLSKHDFSFVRVSGDNTPDGEVLTVGEVRLELA
jgi:tyrosinase